MTSENKPSWFLLFTVFAIACILIAFVATIVFGDSCTALSCGTIKWETVVANEEYIWTEDDEIGRLIREAELPKMDITDCTTLECYKSHPDYTYDPAIEKEKIVADVVHKEIKWPKYTTRVGLWGARKPIPAIKGWTTQERAKEWLENAGLGYTISTWVQLGEKYKIDYTLPLCIAWADSHLGKALASKNNIGNVGNNDRGDRVHFETLDKGIEAIFFTLRDYHTENRKAWMKDSEVIGELSWEWRKRLWIEWCVEAKWFTKCYATSMGVWSSNVTNCMSAIHNEQIDEKYMFRIYSMETM